MAEARSRVALVVIRMAPGEKTDDPQAIVIGTMPKVDAWQEGDWRYVVHRLSKLQAMLDDEQPKDPLVDVPSGTDASFQPFATVDDVATASRLDPHERDEADALLPNDYLKTTITAGGKSVERVLTAFPLRSIEHAYFYSHENGDAANKLASPFAALDTARVVVTASPAPPVPFKDILPAGKDPGSRLLLVPDFSDPNRPGRLAALSLHLEMKVAVNGHKGPAPVRSATDPRMLLDAAVVNQSQSLWVTKNGAAVGSRGLNFRRLRLRCTLGGGRLNEGVTITDGNERDLIRFATDRTKIATIDFVLPGVGVNDCGKPKGNDPYRVDVLPAADLLGLSDLGDDKAQRRFGFRVLAGLVKDQQHPNDIEPQKIGWRFESTVFFHARRFARFAVGRLIPERVVSGEGLAERIAASARTTFAEEQRLDDVVFAPFKRDARTSLTLGLTQEGDQKDLQKVLTKHVLAVADDTIAKIQSGLKRVRDGRPISLLPRLSIVGPKFLSWNGAGFLTDSAPGRRLHPDKPDASRAAALTTFEPFTTEDIWAPGPVVHLLKVDAKFELLRNEERVGPRFGGTIGARQRSGHAFQPLSSSDASSEPRGTVFRLTLADRKSAPADGTRARHVLIGALELALGDAFVEESNFQTQGEIRLLPLAVDRDGHADQLASAIAATIVLPVAQVEPGVQDESERDVIVNARQRQSRELVVDEPDRDAPLLLPLASEPVASGSKASLKLTAQEVATRDRDHTVALSLESIRQEEAAQPPAAVATRRVLVIDPRPFRIAAVEYQPIAGTGSSENNEVAVWNAEGEGGLSWRVRDDGQSVGLELPPQVIGEAMEKNRVDLFEKPQDIGPDQPAAARFGSPTRLRIDPTFAETRFREPGWNLRRILGNALQRQPGARLLDLRVELLYGLLTRVRTDGLFVTELAGAIGEPALPLFDTTISSDRHLDAHKKLVDEVLLAEQFRLAVDKVYRTRPDEYLRIEDGTAFKLRLRRFGEGGAFQGGPKTALRWPVPGGIPSDTGGLVDPEVLRRTFSTSDRDSESFPGGLSWAFESANILMSVYGRPQGDGGNVGGLYLSAHGGYGAQRALFDARKSIVETETTQGRVHRYRLERVGRIGCLWHPAKHVIVYERTVVPSAQFYNADPIGKRQDEHVRRAILRKVEEYVEILKPVRHYPEDGSSVRAAGCLVGAEFKSTKIRVDSDWGSDVRREGWQVPLWNTRFAGLPTNPGNPDDPASIYPKPQIRLTFAGREGDVALEVDEPAKLVFYTSVLRDEDDRTDLWKPVRDIDFCDAPKVSAGRAPTESADLTDAILPPEPEHVPGYEKLTIGLVPSKDAVALAHGRVAEGPIATLRNVTIARSVALSTGENVPEFGRGLGEKVANVRAEIDRRIGQVLGVIETVDRETNPQQLKKELDNRITAACRDLRLAIDKVQGVTNGDLLKGIPANCNGVASQARAYVDGQLARFRTVGEELYAFAAKSVIERIDAVGGVIESEISAIDGVAARVEQGAGELERNVEQRSEEEIRRILAELRGLVAAGRLAVEDVADEGKARIDDQVARIKNDVDTLIETLENDIAEARKKTVANFDAVRGLLGTALDTDAQKVEDAVKAVQTEVERIHTELTAGAGTITQQARDAAKAAKVKAGEARQQLNGVKPKAPEAARRLIEKVDGALAKVESLASYVEGAADAVFDDALKLATDTKNLVDKLANKVAQLKNEVVGLGNTTLDDIQKKLTALLDQATKIALALVAELEKQKTALFAALDAVAADAAAAITELVTAANAQLDALEAAIPTSDQVPTQQLRELVEKLRAIAALVRTAAEQFRDRLDDADVAAKQAREKLVAAIAQKEKEIKAGLDAATAEVGQLAEALIKDITDQCSRIVGEFNDLAKDAIAYVDERLKEAVDLDYLKHDLERDLKAVVGEATESLAVIKAKAAAKAAEVARAAEARVREAAATLQKKVQSVVGADLGEAARRAEGVYQKGDDALRLIRAVGDPPKTDSLGFNRPEVAYVFGEAKELGIDMTPALALVNRAADQVVAVEKAGKAVGELLDSFGVRLPVGQIADQLIPDKLRNLSVSDLLPDMGGIDLRGLLQRVGFPDLDDSDAVKVRHGFDKAARRAWMEADLDVPFAESVPLLSFGPIQLMIDTARFTSRARLAATAGSGLERKMNGRIFGDWRVVCGGQTILTFRQTELKFDDSGRIDFQIQPERVELAAALQFITDLMRATGQKGGLRVEPFMRGGIPSGVAATLDMVLPPIQTGAFGISDLSLHVLFGVAALPRFEIVCDLAVGSRLTPFSLNVWILTGGGYVTQRLTYVPMAKPKALLVYTLDIAILVGLGIGFSFGVVKGGVYLQVGCGIALTWTTGAGGNSTTVRVFLLARGNVDVAGIITASIALLFEISYDGERMIGAGTLSIHVKISVFYTLDVDQHVEYVFAGQKRQESIGGNGSADAYC